MTGPRLSIVGPSPLLSGQIRIGGFKHAFVSLFAACVARRGRARFRNLPRILETDVLCRIAVRLGASVRRAEDELRLDCRELRKSNVDAALSARIHGSLYLIPALLAANGRVRFKQAGGCLIGESRHGGERPIEHMIEVLRRFGAVFRRDGHWLVGTAGEMKSVELDMMAFSDRADILTGPRVSGATKTAIIAACAADGPTLVRHPYSKPDVTELLAFLANAGADVRHVEHGLRIGRGTATPETWVDHELVSDLGEIVTYIALSVMTQTELEVQNVTVSRVRSALSPEIALLDAMGVALRWGATSLRVIPPSTVHSVDIEVTSEGIYSDHQPFFALMLLRGDRTARIREQVWKERFDYASELRKLGANIRRVGDAILVEPSTLRVGSDEVRLHASDLRAAAALTIGAIAADGRSTIDGIDHLERGYGSLIPTLQRLGVVAEFVR